MPSDDDMQYFRVFERAPDDWMCFEAEWRHTYRNSTAFELRSTGRSAHRRRHPIGIDCAVRQGGLMELALGGQGRRRARPRSPRSSRRRSWTRRGWLWLGSSRRAPPAGGVAALERAVDMYRRLDDASDSAVRSCCLAAY
jgi:hypothetical protein